MRPVDDDLISLDFHHRVGIALSQRTGALPLVLPRRKAAAGRDFCRHRHQTDRTTVGPDLERQLELNRHQSQPVDPGHRRQSPSGPQIVRYLVESLDFHVGLACQGLHQIARRGEFAPIPRANCQKCLFALRPAERRPDPRAVSHASVRKAVAADGGPK